MRKGKFLIEINYFNGAEQAKGTVTVTLYEGTDKEIVKVFPFMLNEKQSIKIFEGELSELK